jgi:hypothetical protein
MSQVSTCEIPPHRKKRIVDRAVAAPLVLGAAGRIRDPAAIPAKPVADATRKFRRGVLGKD